VSRIPAPANRPGDPPIVKEQGTSVADTGIEPAISGLWGLPRPSLAIRTGTGFNPSS